MGGVGVCVGGDGGGGGGKRAKYNLKLPISVCHALYIRNYRSCHQGFWYAGVK